MKRISNIYCKLLSSTGKIGDVYMFYIFVANDNDIESVKIILK